MKHAYVALNFIGTEGMPLNATQSSGDCRSVIDLHFKTRLIHLIVSFYSANGRFQGSTQVKMASEPYQLAVAGWRYAERFQRGLSIDRGKELTVRGLSS